MRPLDQFQSRGIVERYAVLLDIGRILTGTLRPDDLYRTIYEQASRALDTTGFYIALHDAATDTARVVFHASSGRETQAEIAFRASHSRVIREGRATEQTPADPDFATLRIALDGASEARSAIAAPILADGNVIGVIGVHSPRSAAYSERDLELLQALAALAGVALGSAEFIQQTERRRDAAERLEAIGRALSASLDLDHVLERVVDAALGLLDGAAAAVLLSTDPRGETLRIAAVGGRDTFHEGDNIVLPEGLRARLIDERRSLVVQNVGRHPLLPPTLGEDGHGTVVAVPLIAGDRVIGALCVGHNDARYHDPEDLGVLERLAVNVAIAIDNARMHEQIRALSLTDPLTGLANRRHLEAVLDREFAAAMRGRRLAVVLFDLDNFKRYNDSAGHQAGDEALRAFARILEHETRALDLAARYGGDEFICVLSDANPDGAVSHMARVQRALVDNAILASIGVTAGHAYYDPSMSSAADLVRAADRDLYRNKRQRSGTG